MAFEEVFRWRRWPWLPSIFGVAFVGFWLSAGQSFGDLGRYIWNSVGLSAGYNEAMVWEWPMDNMPAYVAMVGLLMALLAFSEWRRSRLWGLVSVGSLLGVCFLVFKAAFVRHDLQHEMIARLGAPTLVLIYLPVLWHGFQKKLLKFALLSSLAIGVLGIGFWGPNIWEYSGSMLARTRNQFIGAYAALTGKGNLEERYLKQQRAIAARFPFTPTQGSVDLYSYEQAYVVGPPWNYAPRPVFQSYSAFTPALAEMNARHLRGASAPDTVFFSVQAIDARYPSLEDSLSWPELLSRYDICERIGPHLRLKRSETPRSTILEPLTRMKARLGEEIRIEESDTGPVWAEVEIHPTLFRRLASLFYKAPLPTITVNGLGCFRILPSLAGAGFLLSPFIPDTMSFENLAVNPGGGIAVKSIRLDVGKDGYFQPEVQIRLFRLKITPQRQYALRLFEKSGTVLSHSPAAISPAAKFTPLEQVSIFEWQRDIVFRAMGPKASLLLPSFPLGPSSFIVLRMELTSPHSTTLLVSYEAEKSQGLSRRNTIPNVLVPGRNTIFLAIPAQGLKGRLVLHPGNAPGDYILHSLDIRGSNP